MQRIFADGLLLMSRRMRVVGGMIASRFTMYSFEFSWGQAVGSIGGIGTVHGCSVSGERCRWPWRIAGVAIDTGGYRLHIWAIEADAGGCNHLRAEGMTGADAGQAAISRVLDAVDN